MISSAGKGDFDCADKASFGDVANSRWRLRRLMSCRTLSWEYCAGYHMAMAFVFPLSVDVPEPNHAFRYSFRHVGQG